MDSALRKNIEVTNFGINKVARKLLENVQLNAGRVAPDTLKKYVILSTPRTGSTLFCRTLHEAGLGWPMEWFNDRYIEQVENTLAIAMPDYLGKLLQGASNVENAVFGLHLHVEQYMLFRKRGLDLMDEIGFQGVYYVRRRATFKQAYSFAKALKTDLWTYGAEIAAGGPDGVKVGITLRELMSAAKYIVDQQDLYDAHLKKMVRREYAYEDFVGDLGRNAAEEIAADLGVAITKTATNPVKMEKQSSDFDRQQLQSLLERLGI